MSVPISVVTITASNEGGDYVEIKLSGLTSPPPDEDLEVAKARASELFCWAFGDQPDEIHVHDSMKHRAERGGEGR